MWTKEAIKSNLLKEDKWVERGILAIYQHQTSAEQSTDTTIDANGVGFNAFDAEFLSSLAKGIKKYGKLSKKQMQYGRDKILKYAGQLTKIANKQEG